MTTAHLILRYAHISMGLLALVSGTAALTVRKGSRLHRMAGNAFFVAIATVGISGAIMAAFTKPNAGNLMGGLMAVYLVSTAWAIVIRRPGETGRFEVVAAIGGLGIAITGITFCFQAATSAKGTLHGYPPAFFLIFGSVALLGAAFDVRMIRRGGLVDRARTTRHLSRMCLAMFMATGSFFFGQPRFLPVALRESGLVPILALLPLGLLLYWLIRVRVWEPRIARNVMATGT
jgi:uncharacterized membrane protein